MTSKRASARKAVISIVGQGAEADAWVRALRGIESVETERVAGCGEDELLAALSREGVDAVAFATAVPDLPGAVRRALMARRHVLVGSPVALSSSQLTALDELARRRGRAVVFDSGGLGDERLMFVRKMTSGPQGLWRARYARSLRTGAHGSATLDELAISDLATLLSLVPGAPAWVSAVSPRSDDEAAGADVAMATVVMDNGATIRVDVSMIEPWLRQEIVLACDGRTVVLDALDARAPLQIHAATHHRVPQGGGQWAETVSEHPAGDHMSREARAAEAFIAAVRAGDAAATNASELAVAAQAWEKARESMAMGGEGVQIAGASAASRPALQVIEGGGKHVESDAPALKVIKAPRRA